ncbi:MAG: trehalase family glycosidase, partial [Chloroflexota bacterium]
MIAAKTSHPPRLRELFENVLLRFKPNNPTAPAGTFIFGFVALNQDMVSITLNRDHAKISTGLQNAEYVVYGSYELFNSLLNAEFPNRAGLVSQLEMRPAYPFNNYILSIFLNAFDLAVPDLDYRAERFDGPFPFPPRYPATENPFRFSRYVPVSLPLYESAHLPELIVDDHPEWKAMYSKAWELAFKNLRQPEPASGFINNFIDPAFNSNTFMWDSAFMTMFGRYARQNLDFMGTLNNFYAKQHDDGFICREINTFSGTDLYQSLDPRSTGPNILAWTEWQDYKYSKDQNRLRDVFPGLIAYHRWWKTWRTHPDGSYWTSGWGSGMDNQSRIPNSEYHHQHFSWIDAMMQQVLNCTMLLNIANEIGRHEFNDELNIEREYLGNYINTRMWDDKTGFYFDVAHDGTLSKTKSIGAYWGFLTDIVPRERVIQMINHLKDPKSFNRPHRIPTQAHDSSVYDPFGGYWLGSVWSPTNYMVLQGLTDQGFLDLAFEIALNHVENIGTIFQNTGTLWENYAPEYIKPGKP